MGKTFASLSQRRQTAKTEGLLMLSRYLPFLTLRAVAFHTDAPRLADAKSQTVHTDGLSQGSACFLIPWRHQDQNTVATSYSRSVSGRGRMYLAVEHNCAGLGPPEVVEGERGEQGHVCLCVMRLAAGLSLCLRLRSAKRVK